MYFQKEWKSLTDENHWKKTSGGLKVQVIPLVLFSDDVSGNKSKKWNKFDVWAMLLAGLPRSTNCNLENIHFISASNLVDCLGQTKPLVEDLQGFIQDFSKRGENHLTPPTYQDTVPITNVLTARIHLWKKL